MAVITPTKGWRLVNLRDLWAYRELLWVLAARDIKVRYKQTVLGAAWAIIRPVMTMVVFTLVFGQLAKLPSDGYPYPVFVYAALLPWTFFVGAITSSAGSVVGSANLISKVYFPRLIVPLAAIGSGLVDLAISTAVLLALMAVYGVEWTWQLLAAPVLLVATVFTALGVGTLLAALTVAYRDVTHLMPFLTQIWLFLTPVIYPVGLVPERWQWLLYLNPMAGLIEGFRAAFLAKPFDPLALTISFAVSLVVFGLGLIYFERVERRFADII